MKKIVSDLEKMLLMTLENLHSSVKMDLIGKKMLNLWCSIKHPEEKQRNIGQIHIKCYSNKYLQQSKDKTIPHKNKEKEDK